MVEISEKIESTRIDFTCDVMHCNGRMRPTGGYEMCRKEFKVEHKCNKCDICVWLPFEYPRFGPIEIKDETVKEE